MKNWTHLAGPAVAALPETTVVVVPLGAVEAHGPHLPSGTDAMLAEAILDRAAMALDDTVSSVQLPVLWHGASVEHTERAGTISTSATAFIRQIDDVVASLARHDHLKRIILLSAHGGNNPAARIAAMNARASHGMLCAAVHWMDFGLPETLQPPSPVRDDAHGGWMETSMMLAAYPDLVGDELPAASEKRPPAGMLYPSERVHWGWMSGDLGEDGFIGAPDLASPELGEQLLTHAARSLAELIGQLCDATWLPPTGGDAA